MLVRTRGHICQGQIFFFSADRLTCNGAHSTCLDRRTGQVEVPSSGVHILLFEVGSGLSLSQPVSGVGQNIRTMIK
jgi:hypothetical protein